MVPLIRLIEIEEKSNEKFNTSSYTTIARTSLSMDGTLESNNTAIEAEIPSFEDFGH